MIECMPETASPSQVIPENPIVFRASLICRTGNFIVRSRLMKSAVALVAVAALIGIPSEQDSNISPEQIESVAPIAPTVDQLDAGYTPTDDISAAATFVIPKGYVAPATLNTEPAKTAVTTAAKPNTTITLPAPEAQLMPPAPETRKVKVPDTKASAKENSKEKASKPAELLADIFRGANGAVDKLKPSNEKKITHEKLTLQGVPAQCIAQFEEFRPKIDRMMPVYEEVEKLTGIPRQILAAIHYRESGNDPNRSVWAGELLGSVNPDQDVVKSPEITENARSAAEHFRMMAKAVYGLDMGMNNTVEEYKKGLLSYNRGSMYVDAGQNINDSPYINRCLREEYVNMIWPDSKAEPASVRGYANSALGAMVIVSGLGLEVRK